MFPVKNICSIWLLWHVIREQNSVSLASGDIVIGRYIMAKHKRIAAYTSKAEIIGDLLAWSELSTLSTRREDAKQAFETLVRPVR